MSFLKKAAKKSTDIKTFLRESAAGNGVKYVTEKGARHVVFIPFTETVTHTEDGEVTVKETIAIWQNVHEWNDATGKYKACVCLEGITDEDEDGNIKNDGTCPFCERLSNAWDIYKYRMEKAKESGLTEKEIEEEKKVYLDERKIKEASVYNYMLIAKFKHDDKGNLMIGKDGLPEYELKVMKQSKSKSEKIDKQLENSGVALPGAEIVFDYPDKDDPRILGSQVTISPMYAQSPQSIIGKYPDLVAKINEEASKWEWEGIEKSFPEWQGMTTKAAKTLMDSAFKKYDSWQEALAVDPNAEYLEYVGSTATTQSLAEHSIASTDPNATFKNAEGPNIANI